MKHVAGQRTFIRTVMSMAGLALAWSAAPDASAALIVYGSPGYTPGVGGFQGGDVPVFPGTGVNNAGTAVGYATKYDASGADKGFRAVRWDAATTATELGNLGTDTRGVTSARANAINTAGTAVGSARKHDASGADKGFRAVRWDVSGTAATELGNLGTDTGGLTDTYAHAINSAGSAAGFANKYDGSSVFKGVRAVRWDASGTPAIELGNLGTDTSGFTDAYALTINTAGTAAGYATKYDGSGAFKGQRAVRWDASGTAATELGHLGTGTGGQTGASAFAINSAGTAVGRAATFNAFAMYQGQRAVRWDAAGTAATELGNLGTDSGGFTSEGAEAYAINSAGTAVGRADKYDGAGVYKGIRGVRWDASGTAATELGNLGTDTGGFTRAEAFAINSAGTAVGYAFDYDGLGMQLGDRAVFWGADGVAIDLNSLIDPASGWTLLRASAISDTHFVAGRGLFDPDGIGGQDAYGRLFVMDISSAVPEPGALTLLSLPALALLCRSRGGARTIQCQGTRRRSSPAQPHLESLEVRCLLSYSVIDLGTLGGNYCQASDINAAGLIVGGSTVAGGGPLTHPFLWQDGVMTNLGTLGEGWGSALGINDAGQIVGYDGSYAFLLTPEDTDGNGGPDRWFRDTNHDGKNDLMRSLGAGVANAVNNAGQVVGNLQPGATNQQGFFWHNGVRTDLPVRSADAISNAGQVTGIVHMPTGESSAFLWQGGVMNDIGAAIYTNDINQSGQVAGAGPPPSSYYATLWTPTTPNGTTGSSQALGKLPAFTYGNSAVYQYSYGFATGVNDFGTVIGTQQDTYYDYTDPEYVVPYDISRSFVWANGVMQELATSNATAINNAGKIVGNGPFGYAGISDPRQRAFLLAPAGVAGRHVFFNNSAADGHTSAAGPADDAAIAADKQALRPGQRASFVNCTTGSLGINGVMIDIAGLPQTGTLFPQDFQLGVRSGAGWVPASATPSVSLRRGAGASGTDRATLVFPDGEFRNTWLRITVLANARTGLDAPDVFYFGNLVGDTGNDRGNPTVKATDLAQTRAAVFKTDAASLNLYDFNRDGAVNGADVRITRANQRQILPLFAAPAPAAPGLTGNARYTIFHEVHASGVILAADFSEVKARFFQGLPALTAFPPSEGCTSLATGRDGILV